MSNTVGFDKELFDPKKDKLDRHRLASDIFDVIVDTPLEWSVRVGVYGEWGSGKTTVLRFVQNIAQQEKNQYFFMRFNPWSYNNQNKLWTEFYIQLLTALKNQDFDITDAMPEGILQKISKKFPKVCTAKIPAISSFIYNATMQINNKYANTALSLMSDFFDIQGKSYNAILKKLNGKKIIVAIDDLDRTDPKLIPQLLLALREILDLPGFAFILFMDREKVSKSISQHNKAYGTGHEFLEKIIDFPFLLPEPSQKQKEELFISQLNEISAADAITHLSSVKNYLPSNPRKLKAISRIIKTLNPEILRHEDTEINWPLLLLSSIIKMESPQLFIKIVEALNSEDFLKPWYSDNENEKDERLQSLLDSINDISSSRKNEVNELLKRVFLRHNIFNKSQILYQFNLISYPHYLTWKEFREIFNTWKNKKSLDHVSNWINETSKQRNSHPADVARELFETTISFYSINMENAISLESLKEYDDRAKTSVELLDFIEKIFISEISPLEKSFFLNNEMFFKFFDATAQWVHFAANPIDKVTRKSEITTLLNILKEDFNDIEILHYSLLRRRDNLTGWDKDHQERFLELVNTLLDGMESRILDKIFSLFKIKDAISDIRQYENGNSVNKYYLLSPTSPFLKEDSIKKFEMLAEESANDLIVYTNLKKYFCLLADISQDNQTDFSTFEPLVQILWKAVIITPLQFRFLSEYRKRRSKLIQKGISENSLPLPEWLKPQDINTKTE